MMMVATAQDIIIFGQVVGESDGQPLQAANVWFKNTQIGTATNNEGYFILRTNEPYKTLCISVLGYRRKEVKLTGSDQVLNIALREERNMLSEVVAMPGENEALPLLKRVRAAAAQNDPERFADFSAIEHQNIQLSMANIRRKKTQRRLLGDAMSGQLALDDSTLFVPIYYAQQSDKIEANSGDIQRTNLLLDQKALQVLPPEQIGTFVANYTPHVNFYRNNVTVLQTNFISPLSVQGNIYYQYFLIDSTATPDGKTYYIRFRPKNDKELAFRGEMWIDSATLALTHIKASLSPYAAINFLNGLTIEQIFERGKDGRFYYNSREYAMSFSFNLFDKNAQHGLSAFYLQTIENEVTTIDAEKEKTPDFIEEIRDSAAAENQEFRAAIDSLNQSKLQRIAYNIVDFALTGYIHAWKFDLGPIINWFRYNELEGFRPTLQLRTGEKMMEHFAIGGYFGYGVRDKQWKYGGEIQARWGNENAHSIGIFYDNDVIRYGYRSAEMLNENMYGSPENLLTTASHVVHYKNLCQAHRLAARYRFHEKDWTFTLDWRGVDFFANDAMTFVQNDVNLQHVKTTSVAATLRFARDERTLERFFHRQHLRTKYPIVSLMGEYGYYAVGDATNHYGQLRLTLKQDVPLWSGRLSYGVEGGYIFGDVPWPLLEVPRTARNFWSQYDFGLLSPMEFMTDAYVMGNMRYVTSGWLFNYIPGIKKLNLREDFVFKIAYGGLRSGHSGILALPETATNMKKMPYIEAGVGICNILRILSVQSIWRLTYRNAPDAIKWGMRFRIELGL